MADETTTKKKREKRRADVLPISTTDVLKRVVNGAPLIATRTFPYPFKYTFDDKGDKVNMTTVAMLIERGFITATQSDPMADYIVYHATAAGEKYAKDGPPPVDNSQLDWIGA